MRLSHVQKSMLKKPCPNCGTGKLHEVDILADEEGNYNVLWCNSCECSVDEVGGFIA